MKFSLLQSLITKFPSLLKSHCEALSFRASLRGVQRTTKQSPSSPKLAVILHLYYEDQLPEIARHLQNLNTAGLDYDLYVTSPHTTPLIITNAMYTPTENRGYDIGPFIDALHHINLNNYDYILKLHTKGKTSPNYTLLNNRRLNNALWGKILWNALLGSAKQIRRNIAVMEQNPQIGMLTALHHINLNNYDYILKLHTKGKTSPNYTLLNNRRLNNALWGKILWNALLGSAKQIRRNIAVMEQNPQIGMLTARYCLTSEPKFYQKHLPQINRELQKLGFSPMQNFAFPAGSIFLARTEVLKPFLTYTINDFTLTNGKIKEGTLAHIVERLFGAVTITQGYNLAPAPHKTYAIARLLVGLKRFIYQKKYTSSGKTLIKICKIPVYKKS